MRFNLLQYIISDVKELYSWLEVDFHPLKLCGRVTKVQPEIYEITCLICAVVMLSLYLFGSPGAELGQGSGREGT